MEGMVEETAEKISGPAGAPPFEGGSRPVRAQGHPQWGSADGQATSAARFPMAVPIRER